MLITATQTSIAAIVSAQKDGEDVLIEVQPVEMGGDDMTL